MLMRWFWCFLGTILLTGPAMAQTPTKEDPSKAELETLRLQVKALQAQVQALQAQVRALDKGEIKVPEPLRPPASAVYPSSDPNIKTGVNVGCSLQVIPGVEGASIPQPSQYGEGATIRILTAKDKKILAEGKTGPSGGVLLAVPPGKHLLEVIPRSKGEAVESPIEVTVEKEKVTGVEVIISLSAP